MASGITVLIQVVQVTPHNSDALIMLGFLRHPNLRAAVTVGDGGVHINPVKHGLVAQPSDWPYSTFHHLVATGIYPADWAGSDKAEGLGYKS